MQKNIAIVKEGGKTENAVRKIPIPPILINYLNRYKDSCKCISFLFALTHKGKCIPNHHLEECGIAIYLI